MKYNCGIVYCFVRYVFVVVVAVVFVMPLNATKHNNSIACNSILPKIIFEYKLMLPSHTYNDTNIYDNAAHAYDA